MNESTANPDHRLTSFLEPVLPPALPPSSPFPLPYLLQHRPIERYTMPVQIKPKVFGPCQYFPDMRRVPHDFLGHTPYVDTGATQVLLFNHTDFCAVRRSTTGRSDATTASANDKVVEMRGTVATGRGGGAQEGAAGAQFWKAGGVFLCRSKARKEEIGIGKHCDGDFDKIGERNDAQLKSTGVVDNEDGRHTGDTFFL